CQYGFGDFGVKGGGDLMAHFKAKTKKLLIAIPMAQFEEIKRIVEEGHYATYSDFIRTAIREKLKQFGR
ncbi:MAG: ribbon-helix-helix domain-containing protein, partial [Archaeoglobaceae archaeon]